MEEKDEDEVVSCSSSSSSDEEYEECSSPADDDQRKSQNVDALLRGNLIVKRQPLLPRVLSVGKGGAGACRKPFKPPSSNHTYDNDNALARRLSARKRFVPWGSSACFPRPPLVDLNANENASCIDNAEQPHDKIEVPLPPGIDPLILWHPLDENQTSNLTTIAVDPLLVRFLRPHQREGVQFMFDCVSGLCSAENINGCILADDMGLGKTLQSITLLYTLICQGFDGNPLVRKAIIVTPTSLVSNWEAEIKKWIGERVRLLALCESSREDVLSGIDMFTRPRSTIQAKFPLIF
ncbi:DNA-dependent ATPase protein rad54 [Stylosanthes scabra]|uniref:DNA-dependent ATPase protein rad54 n=1 Tax=Stylosanthes scabra TaxID=79078 RepID=A0ABU6Z669_9FABA|nr:DNA-dependent ATPase protein rad54 [Stylosanthes scabra]